MLYENMLLSKVIEDKNFFILKKFNITANDFSEQTDTYRFIQQYVKANKGTVPDYRTVVDKCPKFEYEAEVADTFKFLCKEVKQASAKRQAYKMLQNEATNKFQTLDGSNFIKWLQTETDRIVKETDPNSSEGSNFAKNGLERKQWYTDAKSKGTGMLVPTPYNSLTQLLGGGMELGDYVLLQAYTNRGKSWIASQMGLTAWKNSFNVLHYSPELGKKQQLDRLDTLNGHYKNTDLRLGTLKNEKQFTEYLEQFGDNQETDYIVKTMEDIELLSVNTIKADIESNPNINVVIVDGFNLMHHDTRSGNSRNAMSHTSRMLRQLCGKYGVLLILVHQLPTSAEKENRLQNDVGQRVPNVARIDQYSETIAVIQDACTVLNFDQVDGIGKLGIAKARVPSVGNEIELLCNFNEGYITEHSIESTVDLPF